MNLLALRELSHEEKHILSRLADLIRGEVRSDAAHRILYSTDASIYEVIPLGVAFPKDGEDLQKIVQLCGKFRLPITVRGAGTSLAGQAIGPGLIVDVGRWMTKIGTLDLENKTVQVEPGVILDDLNRFLAPHNLIFGPDTSTSNRCMIGGMLGNNSCGSHSIYYGQTRDNVVSMEIILADGSKIEVGKSNRKDWANLREKNGIIGEATALLEKLIQENSAKIALSFPKPSVRRRNTGYALDDLANSWLANKSIKQDPSLARFLCGSEGTLAITSSAVLQLVDAPKMNIVVAGHFESVNQALHATIEAINHDPAAVELMDRPILELSKQNPEQDRNRWFVQGDPGAILVVEFYGENKISLQKTAEKLIQRWKKKNLGFAFPIIWGSNIKKVWALRKAGLGVLFGKISDQKPVTLVEDTAVAVLDLPAYIEAFDRIMQKHNTDSVYYGHASVGELHLRPSLNLKDPEGLKHAKMIMSEVAELVQQFKGSLSGEHGDGRLRGPFVKQALGEEAYQWLIEIKKVFDPKGIFNPKVIVNAAPMSENWRFHQNYQAITIPTEFSYEAKQGFQAAVEMCNGTGVCRRSQGNGGTMCPSYIATKEEQYSTRGRANLFRRLIQFGPDALFSSTELFNTLKLCLSCKGCKNDCPSNVDMTRLHAEFLQGWHDRNGATLRSRAYGAVTTLSKPLQWTKIFAKTGNKLQNTKLGKQALYHLLHIDPRRSLPDVSPITFHRARHKMDHSQNGSLPKVCLFIDEMTDLYDVSIGLSALLVLKYGGYDVITPTLAPSGRTYLSKGFVRKARTCIETNIEILIKIVDQVEAIVGIEPSAILTMLDEAPDLVSKELRQKALKIAQKTMLIDHFILRSVNENYWKGRWTEEKRKILLHGHCHQKALTDLNDTVRALSIPKNYEVEVIQSGCCGMAGSFGFEADNYELSMKIGEQVLFPAIRASKNATIVAPGTSCRHQILDGVKRSALHPIQLLESALL